MQNDIGQQRCVCVCHSLSDSVFRSETVHTHWCPPLKPSQVLQLYSVSQKHSGPKHCQHQIWDQFNRIQSKHLLRSSSDAWSRVFWQKKTPSQQNSLLNTHYRPARLHQRLNAEEESHILFILQIIQHPLHTDRRAKHLFFLITKIKMFVLNIRKPLAQGFCTCCTSLLPPLRMEIPSLSVEETMAPGSPAIRWFLSGM